MFFFLNFILGACSITSVILHAIIYINFLHFCHFMFVYYALLVFSLMLVNVYLFFTSNLHFLIFGYLYLLSYCSSCCSWSKSIVSINSLYTFVCLPINYCLLSCNLIGLFIRRLSMYLFSFVFMQLNMMWSIVWCSFPQIHVASSLSSNLRR